jgi:molybdopterin/thiamine biosynthesis adenylyltransferase
MSYEELFQRNLGIFDEAEQEKIRNARVVIVGCGGIGGTLAVVLARSGVGHLVLMEPDTYTPTNMNRQINCYSDTLGTNKAACIRDSILQINPEAEVVVLERGLEPNEIEQAAQLGDIIAPVMDAWPLSLTALEIIRKLGKPAIMAYPVGALGRVSVFLAGSPSVAECLAMPFGFGYQELKEYTARPEARCLSQYYVTDGAWREDWFEQWTVGKVPHAQLCTMVWITSCLAAQEILKLITGKWKPVVAPYYWHVTPTGAGVRKWGWGRRLVSRWSRTEWAQQHLSWLGKSKRLLRVFTRLLE